MNDQSETPFDNIEGSHEYVAMLADAVDEARRDVEAEIAAAERERADRRKEALLLVSYNLAKLNLDRKSTRLNSSHLGISYAVFCLKKKQIKNHTSCAA